MQKSNENAANRYSYVGEVYNIGEKEIKNRILNELSPEWKSLHENGYICEKLSYEKIIKQMNAENASRAKKLKNGEPVYGVTEYTVVSYYDYLKSLFSDMGNEQSGGMALANYDNDTAEILERIGVDVIQNEELIRSCTADFIEWCNGTHTQIFMQS